MTSGWKFNPLVWWKIFLFINTLYSLIASLKDTDESAEIKHLSVRNQILKILIQRIAADNPGNLSAHHNDKEDG